MHATLVDTALRVYGRFVRPLSSGRRAGVPRGGAAGRAARSACPPRSLPPTIGELRAWMDEMMAAAGSGSRPAARASRAPSCIPCRSLPRVAWDAAHLVSLATLPDATLRRQYGIGWSPARERGVDGIAAVTRAFSCRCLPALRSATRRRRAPRSARRPCSARDRPEGPSLALVASAGGYDGGARSRTATHPSGLRNPI